MISADSAQPGRVSGIEVYDLSTRRVTRAELRFRGIEHGDTSFEVRIFFNAPDADDQTPQTVDAGYAGHVSVSGHGHHVGDDERRPRKPIDVTIDVTEAFHAAVESQQGVRSITLVPVTRTGSGDAEPAIADTLWKYADFELRTHDEPAHASTHIVDEFGSIADA